MGKVNGSREEAFVKLRLALQNVVNAQKSQGCEFPKVRSFLNFTKYIKNYLDLFAKKRFTGNLDIVLRKIIAWLMCKRPQAKGNECTDS